MFCNKKCSRRAEKRTSGVRSWCEEMGQWDRATAWLEQAQEQGHLRCEDELGRGLHSSTLRLNVSSFCVIGGTFRGRVGGA